MDSIFEQSAYKEDPRLEKVAQFVSQFKNEYYSSAEFSRYKKRCDVTQGLVNQEAWITELALRFNFVLGMCRKHRDTFVSKIRDIFDADKWVNLSSLKTGDDTYKTTESIEHFANSVLMDVDYQNHWIDRMSFLPVFGWSPSFVEFRWNAGYSIKPQASTSEASGIVWGRDLDESLAKPAYIEIHPYNWFGDVNIPIRKQFRQGYIRRWGVREVIQAMDKFATAYDQNGNAVMVPMIDEAGNPVLDELGQPIMEQAQEPLYNSDGLNYLYEKLKNGTSSTDKDYFDQPQRNGSTSKSVGSGISHNLTNSKCVDVLYYIGTLDEVDGFEGDSNIYVVEVACDRVIRIQEHPIDTMIPITHVQTHPHATDCFTDTMLDATVPHDKIMDLLINMGIENTVNDLHRTTVLYEDDFLNIEDFKNPSSLETMLYLRTGGQYKTPVTVDKQSGSLQSMQQIFGILATDRQKAGVTDQELGVQQAGEKTATAARILASATNMEARAFIKAAVNQAMLPEIRYTLLLAMQHYSPSKLMELSKDGEIMRLSEDVAKMLVNRNGLRINDNFTRDKESDAVRIAEFLNFVKPLLQNLSTPRHAINMARQIAKLQGIDEIVNLDSILPEAITEEQEAKQESHAQIGQMQPTAMPTGNPVPINQQVAQGPIGSETPQQVEEAYGPVV